MTSPASLNAIYDPATYAIGPPHELFAELRRSDPVHWVDLPGQPGYWAVLKHADVDHASRRHDLFSSEVGGIMVEDLDAEKMAKLRGMLLGMDPPRHRVMRKPLAPSFALRAISGLEPRIRAIAREVLDTVPDGEPIDFVADVADHLPARVVGELLGLPREDWERTHRMASVAGNSGRAGNDGGRATEGVTELGAYGYELACSRRALEEMPADLTTLILESDFGGDRISEVDFAMLFIQIFTAANDTTVSMFSQGLAALLDHPAELAALRDDRSLAGSAIEEILRYCPPLHYFRRTATQDTELRGRQIAAGDKVALYYTSANRDEEVFTDPHRFEVRRSPNKHIAFGIGEHYCLGVHLARLEGRVFLEELFERFPHVESAGVPVRKESNFNNGLESLPVVLSRSAWVGNGA